MFDEHIALLDEAKLEEFRAKNYGSLSLDSAVDVMRLIRVEIERARAAEGPRLPPQLLEAAANSVKQQLDNLVAMIGEYVQNGPGKNYDKDQIRDTANAVYINVIQTVRPLIPVDDESLSSQRAEYELRLTELDALKREYATATESVRDVAASSATTNLAEYYENEEKEHTEAASRFQLVGWGGAVVLAVLAWVFFFHSPPTYDTDADGAEQIVQFIRSSLGRVILLSIAGYVFTFGFRNYRVNKHLQTLNSRRATALRTSELLRTAFSDPDSRNIIMAELVKSIFTGDDTGYLTGDSNKTVIESPGSTLAAISGLSRTQSTSTSTNAATP